MVAGKQLNVLQCEQQRPGEQVAGRIREARQEPLRNGQVQENTSFIFLPELCIVELFKNESVIIYSGGR